MLQSKQTFVEGVDQKVSINYYNMIPLVQLTS